MKFTPPDRRGESQSNAAFEIESGLLARLRSLAQVYRLRSHQQLDRFTPSSICIVRAGQIAIEEAPNPAIRSILELLYPGDVVVPALLAPALTMTAATPAEVWKFPCDVFSQEMQRSGALADHIVRQLSAQHERILMHVAILAGLRADQRVAALLIEAACRIGAKGSNGVMFDMPLSRRDVAKYLATNADTLSRIMSRFTQSGIIERTGRTQMTIRDWDGLLAQCPVANIVVTLHKRSEPVTVPG